MQWLEDHPAAAMNIAKHAERKKHFGGKARKPEQRKRFTPDQERAARAPTVRRKRPIIDLSDRVVLERISAGFERAQTIKEIAELWDWNPESLRIALKRKPEILAEMRKWLGGRRQSDRSPKRR